MIQHFTKLFLLPLSVILLSSCADNSLQKRISTNPDIFEPLSNQHKSLVQRGKIEKGMDKKAVYLAWGSPSRSSKGANSSSNYERWYYYNYSPSYAATYSGGYGYRSRGFYGSSIQASSDYNSELDAKVEFRKGHVYSWESAR